MIRTTSRLDPLVNTKNKATWSIDIWVQVHVLKQLGILGEGRVTVPHGAITTVESDLASATTRTSLRITSLTCTSIPFYVLIIKYGKCMVAIR